jgi:hypothetical protein
MANLVDRMKQLLGKRSDDPQVLQFHQEEGLAPPPHVFNVELAHEVKHPSKHYEVQYTAELKLEGFYPPRRENGQYVAYLSNIELKPEFAESLADGATTKLTEKEAKAKAVESSKNGYARFHIIERKDGRSMTMVYDADKPHELMHVRVSIDELDEEDDEQAATLERLAAAAPKIVPRPRVAPAKIGPAAKEKFPEVLARLAAVGEDEGFGEDVDLELMSEFDTGGPEAWTGNPEAEHYFRVFGADGSGGLLAFWLVEAGKPLAEQPIVFLESEGAMGIVARNLADFVVMLADGVGPYELVSYGTSSAEPIPSVRAIADEMPGTKGRHAIDVIRDANKAYPDFEAWMRELRGEEEDEDEDEDD